MTDIKTVAVPYAMHAVDTNLTTYLVMKDMPVDTSLSVICDILKTKHASYDKTVLSVDFRRHDGFAYSSPPKVSSLKEFVESGYEIIVKTVEKPVHRFGSLFGDQAQAANPFMSGVKPTYASPFNNPPPFSTGFTFPNSNNNSNDSLFSNPTTTKSSSTDVVAQFELHEFKKIDPTLGKQYALDGTHSLKNVTMETTFEMIRDRLIDNYDPNNRNHIYVDLFAENTDVPMDHRLACILTLQQIIDRKIRIVVFVDTIVRFGNIGVFNATTELFDIDIFKDGGLDEHIEELKGDPQAGFEVFDSGLSQTQIDSLRGLADEHPVQSEDMKLVILTYSLAQLIGSEKTTELVKKFGAYPDTVVIRKTAPTGKSIGFHVDSSVKTMQIALSTTDEVTGGQLIFVSKGKVHPLTRTPGTATIHDNTIVHGVSRFPAEGTPSASILPRYALFFLKENN